MILNHLEKLLSKFIFWIIVAGVHPSFECDYTSWARLIRTWSIRNSTQFKFLARSLPHSYYFILKYMVNLHMVNSKFYYIKVVLTLVLFKVPLIQSFNLKYVVIQTY